MSEDFGLSPFEIDLGWNPKSSLDMIVSPRNTNQSIEVFKNRLRKTLDNPKYLYEVVKSNERARSSLKNKSSSYKVVDKLYTNSILLRGTIIVQTDCENIFSVYSYKT